GINRDGTSWKIPIERAISGLLAKKWELYIRVNDHNLNLVVKSQGEKQVLTVELPVVGFTNIDLINLCKEHD
ncbi:MAG: hypothetical protein ACRC3Z_09635, partial [Phocaeicola sp.]